MENNTPQHGDIANDPKTNNPNNPTNVENDRPSSTADGISDQGTKAKDLDSEQQGDTNASENEVPELNPDRNDVEGQGPTEFDIDESTG